MPASLGWFGLLAAAIYLLVVAYVARLALLSLQRAGAYDAETRQLARRGQESEAELTGQRLTTRHTRYGPRHSYFITLRFTPAGAAAPASLEKQILADDYANLHVGDRLRLRYLPGQPAIAHLIAGAREQNTGARLRARGLAQLAVVALLLVAPLIAISVPSRSPSIAQATQQALSDLATSLHTTP